MPLGSVHAEHGLKDDKVVSVSDNVVRRISASTTDYAALNNEARAAAAGEKRMTLWQALRTYPKAAGWSVLLSTAIVMEGYDTLLLANFFALPSFILKFGTFDPTTRKYVITAAWRAGLTNGAAVGEILGLFATGIIQERFGYRRTIMGALVLVTGFIFITFFAKNLPMLLAGEILCGLPWGKSCTP